MIKRTPKLDILETSRNIWLITIKNLQHFFVLFALSVTVFSGCVSTPTVVQSCNLRNAIARSEGLILLATIGEKDHVSWFAFNLNTDAIERHPVLDVFERIPPTDVNEVKVSPSGEWVAYTSAVPQTGYYIMSIDGLSVKFVPPEKYSIIYSEKQQKWFLQVINPRSLSALTYPFLPNEQEQKNHYPNIDPKEAEIATSWVATSGIQEIPALVVTNGVDIYSYLDWGNDWQSLDGWLVENTLMLTRYAGAYLLDADKFSSPLNDHTILFNPFTGEKLVSGDNYPDISISSWAPVYSPSRIYTLYLGEENSLIVVDSKKNTTSLQVKIPNSHTVPIQPLWVNETEFIYFVRDSESNTDEWFHTEIPGKEYPLSDLRNYFNRPTISSVLSPKLSPSKDFLSFWITHSVGENAYKNQLLFLDIRQRTTYDFYITANGNINTDPNVGQTWLEKDKYIFTVPEGNGTRVKIVNIARLETVEIFIPIKTIIVGTIRTLK